MVQKLILVVLVMVFMLSFGSERIVTAMVDPHSPFIPYHLSVLPNGLRVVVKEAPSYPIAAVNMWVGAGGRHDPPDMSGLAHFFEHIMLLKGTKSRPGSQLAREVESVGGALNAMTSLDFTNYYIVVPSQHIDLAMELQADAVLNSTFLQEDIDQERMVIHEEIRMREDTPPTKLIDMVLQDLFAGTPYERPVLGTLTHLGTINRPEMLDFFATYYVPNNMTLVVTGDVNAQEIVGQATALYGHMEPRSITPQPHIAVPQLNEARRLQEDRDVDQTYLMMAFPGPGIGDRDAVALSVAATILGNGRASRLYAGLREQHRLVTTVGAAYVQFAEIGLFAIELRLPSENKQTVERMLQQEIVELQRELVSDTELERAHAMARSSFAFSAESNLGVALALGQFSTCSSVDNLVNYAATIESITAEDIQRVANRYLDPENYVLSEIRPKGRP